MRPLDVLSPVLFLLVLMGTANGEEHVTELSRSEHRPGPSFDLDDPFSLNLPLSYYSPEPYDWVGAVTMTELPPGSLYTTFDGFHGVVVKHLRGQYKRFVRRALRKGWMVLQDDEEPSTALHTRLAHIPPNPLSNGNWWERTWWESMPAEKGGAPETPYIQIIGEEIAFEFGPLTVTNTLKFRFDYVAFFELQPDPTTHDHSKVSPRVALDVRPSRNLSIGTHFRFDVKPRIRIGLPQKGDMLSTLRSVSVEASFALFQSGQKVIEGEIECRWREKGGFAVTLEVALVSW